MYQRPAQYQQLFGRRENDLSFYLELAATVARPVLELGVGTGRAAVALARAGHQVHGVDLSEPMLGFLEERLAAEPPEVRRRVSWERGDYRSIRLEGRFSLVTCPFNGIAHNHSLEQLAAFFETVAAHLEPEGVFACDTLLPDPAMLQGEAGYVPWFRDPVTGEASRYQEQVSWDPFTQLMTIATTIWSLESETEPVVLELPLRLFFPQEMHLLLIHHGFEVLRQERSIGDAVGWVCRRR